MARTYQNLIEGDVTAYVLRQVQPVVVFSGDDHDHCEVIHHGYRHNQTHSVPGFELTDVPELTVKSMSMTEGVHRPGYAWLQLSSGTQGIDYRPCLMPNPIFLWVGVYLPLFVVTLVYLFLQQGSYHAVGALLPSHMPSAPRRARSVRVCARTSNVMRCLRRLACDASLVGCVPLLLWLCLQS